ncbi:1822_t:CDS:2 [Funneliformis mosseae]|uniref:1822_t:CDS:1 n=1 Tax=Funneliformis mosseae TaxID=27381 RepID=A0A9N8WRF0_FUNMO|nr:1822_t:CDS:2 [Funneliformis mosseae]
MFYALSSWNSIASLLNELVVEESNLVLNATNVPGEENSEEKNRIRERAVKHVNMLFLIRVLPNCREGIEIVPELLDSYLSVRESKGHPLRPEV